MSEWISHNRSWFEPYVRDMADRMGLKDWDVEIAEELPEDLVSVGHTMDAATFLPSSYKNLTLYIKDHPHTAKQVRSLVAHELVHALTRDWMEAAQTLENHVNPIVFDLYSMRLSHEMEQAVEAIAVAWSAALPLPKMAKGK